MRAQFLAFVVAMGFCAFVLAGTARAEVVVGQAAPALVTQTLDDKKFDLADFKGKVVLVHFWATWCGPCREEMPALEAVWRKYHSQGLEILAVSADRPRARGDVDQVMHFFGFPAAMLGALRKNDFGTPAAIPITYVIGKDGNIAAILTPDTQPLTEAGLGDEIKALLDAKLEAKTDAKTDDKADAKPAN